MSVMMIQSGRFGTTAPFSPLDLSPALWIDPSDAATVTISGSSGAYIGPNGLVIPGAGANYATAPSVPAYNITDDIDVIVKATAVDWTPAAYIYLASRRGGGFGWGFWVEQNTGKLGFTIDGISDYLSSVGTGVTDGATKWVRATRARTAGEVKFWTSDDGATWTQLGATVTGVYTGSMGSSTLPMNVGYSSASLPWNGTIHRAIVKNGIDGTTVFDADFESATPYVSAFTESALGAPVYVVSSTATSATANYSYIGPEGLVCSGSGLNVAKSPDIAAYTSMTNLVICARLSAVDWTPGSTATFIGKRDNSAAGFSVRVNTGGTIALLYGLTPSGSLLVDTSTAAPPFTNGATYWIKVDKDYSTGNCSFWYAADQATEPSSWTQIGTTVAGTAGTPFDNTHELAVGGGRADAANEPWLGTIKRAIVKSGSTAVFDADFTAAADYATSFVESSSNAATVTITATNTPANAAGALVSQINDKSGNARHLTQGTAANMPKYWNGRNGLNCLVFVTDDSMASTLFAPSSTSEAFLVRESVDISQIVLNGTAGLHGWWVATSGSGSTSVTQGSTLTGLFANGLAVPVTNRGTIYTGTVGAKVLHATGDISGWPSVGINGWQATFQDDARIGELVLVDSTLAAGDVAAMDSYAMTKWGIS